jgi:hypothetical protein
MLLRMRPAIVSPLFAPCLEDLMPRFIQRVAPKNGTVAEAEIVVLYR